MSKEQRELTEEEKLRKEEAKKRQLANLKIFKPYSELTEEELKWQKEQTLKGGKARGEQLTKAKNLKEIGNVILDTKVSREVAERLIGESAELLGDNDLTISAMLMLSAVREGIEQGNIKALEFIRDTTGQKPKDTLDVNTNVISEQDKMLLEKLAKRQNVLDVG